MRRRVGRGGQLNGAWWGFLSSVVVLAVLVVLLVWDQERPPEPDRRPLVVSCAAGLRKPFEEAARDYERDYGVKVLPDFRGSDTLLAGIRTSRRGDLYIPADSDYIDLARKEDLL